MAFYSILQLAIGASILFALLYKYITYEYLYWKKRKVPYIEPTFPYGNIKDQVTNKADIGRCFKALYDQMPEEKYFGIFELGRPTLVLKDLNIIKAVMVTDFNSFEDRGHIHEKVKKDFLAAENLFNLKNLEWRHMRNKLLPTFTSGRMKMMFHLMQQCSDRLDKYLTKKAKHDPLVELKDLITCFTSDVISSCLFGIESNAIEDKDSGVRKISRLVFPTGTLTMVKLMLSINHPYIYEFLGLEINHQKVKQFFLNVVKDTYNFRTKNNSYRNDFLDLLIKIKQNKNLLEDENNSNQESRQMTEKDDGLTFEQMAAQMFVMFAAGFETSSTTTTMALYEMCRHPEVLDKAVQEIDHVLKMNSGQISYHSLKQMAFLDQVIHETLRLYPSLPILTRKCTKPYTMPGSDLTINKGLRIIIPIFAIGRDDKHFPEPLKFDPDRFSPSRDHQIPKLSFGDGPMSCIGIRFGKMQMKCALATILSKFTLSTVPETPRNITFNPCQFLPTPMESIYFKVSKRY